MYPYTAQVPWPHKDRQLDWIDQLQTLTLWLNATVGPENWSWALSETTDVATVAFTQDKYKTLFLLNWAR